MTVAVVTDSTASLPADLVAAAGLFVVPLHVIIDDHEFTEGVDITVDAFADALRRSTKVTTSRPAPLVFAELYQRLAGQGFTDIVSIHLSAELSGTVDAAVMAARSSPVPVLVVDSHSVGMALGYAALAAADAARAGADAAEVARVAEDQAKSSTLLFYVHSLDQLRRGGRIGAAAAWVGSTFGIKPLLAVDSGHIQPVEKLRTTGKALARLVELASYAAQLSNRPVAMAVQHLEAADRAEKVAAQLADVMGDRILDGRPRIVELGAVLGAHLGAGALGVVVSPDLRGSDDAVPEGKEVRSSG